MRGTKKRGNIIRMKKILEKPHQMGMAILTGRSGHPILNNGNAIHPTQRG